MFQPIDLNGDQWTEIVAPVVVASIATFQPDRKGNYLWRIGESMPSTDDRIGFDNVGDTEDIVSVFIDPGHGLYVWIFAGQPAPSTIKVDVRPG